MASKISLVDKLDLVSEHRRPKVIAALNGPEIKIIEVLGEFPRHPHDQEGEFFMVWKGQFRVEFRDKIVRLGPGDCVVVPRGIEHGTCADEEAGVLCFEPGGVLNTGNVVDAHFTAPKGVTI